MPRKRNASPNDEDVNPSTSSRAETSDRREDKSRSGLERTLNDDELISEALKVAMSKDPELMILKLMESHSFSSARLQELLIGEFIGLAASI